MSPPPASLSIFFFFNDTATTEIYTLSLHDALPIFGELEEHRAPGGVDFVVGNKISSESQIAPQVPVSPQHLRDALGRLEAGVRPKDARLRPLPEQALHRVDVGVRVQEKVLLARELDHGAR